MSVVKLEQDLNNNSLQSPPKLVPVESPQRNSPCTSPRTSKGSPIAFEFNSDLDEGQEDEDTTEEAQPKGKRPPGAVRRRNERERNRVKHINKTFSVLRQHLPSRKANKKLSKVETLRSAVDYIKHLRQLLSDHDSLTAAISLEQALIAHNQRLIHQQRMHQHQHQIYHRLQRPAAYQSGAGPSTGSRLNSSLCSPTGPVNSPQYSPMVSPDYSAQESAWEQNTNTDAELLDLAAESCMTDMDLW